MTDVFIGLGSNQGRPLAQIAKAIDSLRQVMRVDHVSSIYLTEPVGYRDQPDFHNAVLRGSGAPGAMELLREALRIENELQRMRPFRNAPRTVDIDLLSVGDLIVDTPELQLPHPRMHERAFVLVPLVEIAPEWRHPVLGLTARELLAALRTGARIERLGELGHLHESAGGT